MRRTMCSLPIVPCLVVTASMNASMAAAQSPSAEEIVERFVEAVGDPDRRGGEPTRTTKGYYKGSHTSFYGVDSLPYEAFFQGTDRWTRLWPGSGITETINGDDGWRWYPQAGARPMGRRELAFLRRDLPFASVLEWMDLWEDLEFLGREEIEGEETLAVAMTIAQPDVRAVRYFAARTHLLVRTRVAVEEGSMQIDYSDYRLVDGMRVPFRVEFRIGSDTHHVYETKEVAHNVRIDATRFAKPGVEDHD